MQPVQDLTVEDRVSRTQYQYSLEDPDAAELAAWAPRFVEKLQPAAGAARRRERPAERGASRRRSIIDRATASRLGITPQAIDDALYDAFGQRQISTMFTQLNQYRVVLEARARASSGSPDDLAERLLCARPGGGSVPLSRVHAHRDVQRSARHQPPGAVPGRDGLLQPRARRRRWRGGARDRAGARRSSGMPASIQAGFQGTAQAFQASLVERAAADPRGARDGLHRARRPLRELHPPDHDPLDAAVGRRRRAPRRSCSAGSTSASSR